MDCPIRHLEAQGVMLNVFNQLQGLDNFVVCSSVSKTWHALVREARPTCLVIGKAFPALDAEGAACVLRWIQAKQRAGHLQNLREFCLVSEGLFRDQYEELALQSAFFEATIMCTGFWNLEVCTIEGPFSMEQALGLLPITLKQLALTAHEPPPQLYLSALDRFVDLQLLELAGSDREGHYVIIIDGTLPALRSLRLLSPFCVECSEGTGHTVNDIKLDLNVVLPCMQQAQVSIIANDAGAVLANALLSCKDLGELDICFVEGPLRVVNLKVPRSSSLMSLRLVGPPKNVEVSLEICKTRLEYDCRRVSNVWMPKAFVNLSKLQIV